MTIHTEHKVTLTEGQIGLILYTILKYWCVEKVESPLATKTLIKDNLKFDPKSLTQLDAIFEELEGTIDRHYAKIEKAQSKQPTMEW